MASKDSLQKIEFNAHMMCVYMYECMN